MSNRSVFSIRHRRPKTHNRRRFRVSHHRRHRPAPPRPPTTISLVMSSSTGSRSVRSNPRLDLPKSAVGASAEYRHRLQAVYEAPTRRSQPVLHPFKENGGLWIGIDDSVTSFIKRTWQNNFWGPWKNWTDVKKFAPEKIQSWWGTFVQNYYWDPVFEDIVFYEWKEKTKLGIGEEISRKHRKGVQPVYISEDDWATLLEQWQTEKAIGKSKTAAESRKTPIQGKSMHKHSAGPRSFSKIDYELQQKGQGSEEPSILDLVKETHTRADGTYVDPVIEGLVREVEEEASQNEDSTGTAFSSSGTPREFINQLYFQRVKPKYGHAYGVGSARTQFYHHSVQDPSETQPDLRTELNQMKGEMTGMGEKIELILRKLDGRSGSSGTTQPEDSE